jgi:methionyl-tRNA formyltransferase
MTVIFFGTPAFALPALEALLASRHRVLAVVTQPDRPSGRGQRLAEPPVKSRARQAGLPVWQPDRLKDEVWLGACRALGPDIGVVVAYGRILPQVLLDIPRFGFVNVHASLLPRYRGASPVQHAVMNGERETGVCIMRVVPALDAGPVLAVRRRPIGSDETAAEVERDLAGLGAALLVDTLDSIEAGTAREVPQDERDATYAPRLTKEDGLIDWTKPAPRLHDFVRGLHPWPLAWTWLDGARLTVLRGRPAPEVPPPGVRPGTVIEAPRHRLVVACGADTAYELIELVPEGRRPMDARAFLAGHPLEAGHRFGER